MSEKWIAPRLEWLARVKAQIVCVGCGAPNPRMVSLGELYRPIAPNAASLRRKSADVLAAFAGSVPLCRRCAHEYRDRLGEFKPFDVSTIEPPPW